ncbi:MAG: response regulator transcription factor [Candidatus Dormibacteraeota bacterium]|nr:response regulator transcription factor [Candidatus Dormibacteraeota bacterium]MBO0745640.1 response regulator transcription factor [Candidatus Dormibacteraeota bacterium]
MARILVVEDEVGLCNLLRTQLEHEGHQVTQAFDGVAALHLAAETDPQLVVLDWMLPGKDGIEVCRELRRTRLAPIIMLTARDQESDRVLGLEAGADDYVVKPFSILELMARVRAMLRRVALDTASTQPRPDGVISEGPLVLEPAVHRARLDGAPLELTRREMELLQLLVGNPGRTFTRDFLLDRVWGADYDGMDRAVDTQMARLRRKLGSFGDRFEAVWGVGYRYRSTS